MIPLRLAAALVAAGCVAGCTSFGDSSPSGNSAGSTAPGGFVRSNDTLGTQRRVDVYGGSTAPVLPTIGAPGFGK